VGEHPRPAEGPAADFIVGNPPFLGTARTREDLGDAYAETLRAAYPAVPESADFVLYWWHKAAALVRAGKAQRFGLITTNSLRQTFARRVVQRHLFGVPALAGHAFGVPALAGKTSDNPDRGIGAEAQPAKAGTPNLSLVFAIPDHPWVDTAEGAAVRIAMTVGVVGEHPGELLEVTDEQPQDDGSEKVTLRAQRGKISADLTVGADVASVIALKANEDLVSRGVQTIGEGFVVEEERAKEWIAADRHNRKFLRPFLNGKDMTSEPRGVWVIDFFGLTRDDALKAAPVLYQHLLATVKPERDQGRRDTYRKNWWILGEPQPALRAMTAGLRRFIVLPVTAKHRFFQLLDATVLADQALNVFAFDDGFMLGLLSSRIHVVFALAAGGRLGVGNDPRYNNTRCFETFPFPLCGEPEQERIRALAEALDAHRKRVQAQHPGLTLTGLYNVLEKLRSRGRQSAPSSASVKSAPTDVGGYELSAKERLIHDQGLVSVLQQLHAARAAEEARGIVHWLRPDYQCPPAGNPKSEARNPKIQATLHLPEPPAKPRRNQKSEIRNQKLNWPQPLAERVRAVETALHRVAGPVTATARAKAFARAQPAAVAEILETLVTLGRARQQGETFTP